MSPLLQNELFSKWSSASISARHKLLAIRRQEGIEEVKRKGIIIDREVSLGTKLVVIMDNWSDQLRVIGEVDVIVDTRSVYRSDETISNFSCGNWRYEKCKRQQNIILDVPLFKIYLAIKLFHSRQDGYVALLALLYLRNKLNPTVPVIVKSFGTASLHVSTQNYLQRTVNVPANTITGLGFGAGPCNDANIQDYQIPIPTILFFNGVPGDIPAGVPNNFNIDLWKLQDVNLNSWVRKLTT
ncbi:1088_t:CDS:2 [Entrophospora sp. SA101]|nr:1088_t:CDS:2 [Entrophospora sp. SA101]CAJ0924554.1 17812_t:CDS:2 [Entrophospora sp. SA101]